LRAVELTGRSNFLRLTELCRTVYSACFSGA
jgi:hypothetical protein